ncbi:MAG: HAD family hydrolase [Candidatus Hodarchaeota archaeon]
MIGSKIKAVLFDLDGTLIDTRKRFYLVFKELLKEFSSTSIDSVRFGELFSRNELDKILVGIKHKFLPEFLKRYQYFSVATEKPFAGVKETLQKLNQDGFKIGVVTGRISSFENVLLELARHDLSQYVDVIVTKLSFIDSYPVDHLLWKTDEIKEAAEKLKVEPSECLFVGDHVYDVLSGKAVGALTVALMTGGAHKDVLLSAQPNAIFTNISSILTYLKSIKQGNTN